MRKKASKKVLIRAIIDAKAFWLASKNPGYDYFTLSRRYYRSVIRLANHLKINRLSISNLIDSLCGGYMVDSCCPHEETFLASAEEIMEIFKILGVEFN